MITTALSFSTANMICKVGATPVFVDVDPRTRNIDLDAVEAAITPRTRAILPVDLAGLPVDLDALYALARRHRLRVIEDAAQAIGSRWKRPRASAAIGDLVSFSFHAEQEHDDDRRRRLVLNDAAEARRVELLRFQGMTRFADGGMRRRRSRAASTT